MMRTNFGRRALVLAIRLASVAIGSMAYAQSPTDGAATSAFFSVSGVRVHYILQGRAGSSVVLIHGWQGSAESAWQGSGVMTALARNHRVVALDLPGFGGSDKPETPDAYGVHWSEDVLRLLDHLKIGKAHIVGFSMGGMVTLKFAVDHPDRMLSGTLVGMGLLPEQVKAVRRPMIMLVGSKDPVRQAYIEPLLAVRRDWRVVEIIDADHVRSLFKAQFREELARWLDRSR